MYNKIICLFLLLCCLGTMFLFGCSNKDDASSENTNKKETVSDEEIVEAKQEVENYEQKICAEMSESSKNEVVALKEACFEEIDANPENFENSKKICLLEMELVYIADIKNQKLAEISSNYDYPIQNMENILFEIEVQGYYTGSQASYNLELSDIDSQLREISVNKEKEKRYIRAQAIANGSNNTGWLQSKLNEVDQKYARQRENLTELKECLQALWENRELYNKSNAILLGLIDEKDELIASANNEYAVRKNEIDTEIARLHQ